MILSLLLFQFLKVKEVVVVKTTALGVHVNKVAATQFGHKAGYGLCWPTNVDMHQPINGCLNVCYYSHLTDHLPTCKTTSDLIHHPR